MGTYYIAANQTKRQRLEPSRVGNGGVKFNSVCFGPFANLLAFAMLTEWRGDHVVILPDNGDAYDLAKEQYTDATSELLDQFNEAESEIRRRFDSCR